VDYLQSYGTNNVSHKKLAEIVDTINDGAKKIIQQAATNFRDFEEKISEMLSDARRSEALYVTNIKSLLSSPRNREKSEVFERNLQKWPIFVSIMQNYARQT
jgi:arsenate reductase-like glutaredoxin family protein